MTAQSGRIGVFGLSGSILVPMAVMLGLSGLLLFDPTESFGEWLLAENRPVELLTFVAALAAAFVVLSMLLRSQLDDLLSRAFIGLFGLLMFFLAMEEISWGQQFFGFATPESWRVRNRQDELTLHNYDFEGVGFLEIYPLAFALAGLAGIGLGLAGVVPKRICPPAWMWPWFAVVAAHSSVDLLHEFTIPSTRLDDLVNHLDEAAEMLVAISGLVFVLTKRNPRPEAPLQF